MVGSILPEIERNPVFDEIRGDLLAQVNQRIWNIVGMAEENFLAPAQQGGKRPLDFLDQLTDALDSYLIGQLGDRVDKEVKRLEILPAVLNGIVGTLRVNKDELINVGIRRIQDDIKKNINQIFGENGIAVIADAEWGFFGGSLLGLAEFVIEAKKSVEFYNLIFDNRDEISPQEFERNVVRPIGIFLNERVGTSKNQIILNIYNLIISKNKDKFYTQTQRTNIQSLFNTFNRIMPTFVNVGNAGILILEGEAQRIATERIQAEAEAQTLTEAMQGVGNALARPLGKQNSQENLDLLRQFNELVDNPANPKQESRRRTRKQRKSPAQKNRET